MYIIYTERYLGNGSVHRDQYKCKSYSRSSDGTMEFWDLTGNEHYIISFHKMDHIMIQQLADDKNNKDGKGDEIKCTT